jgi:DNA replication licensing factor MCM6
MALRGEGLTDGAGPSATPANVVYVLHPNCAVEEF